MAPQTVIKTTGEEQEFSQKKLQRSLRRAGADTALAKELTEKIAQEKEVVSTTEIHERAYKALRRKHRPLAARYNLKRALQLLGPTGYPFEQFFAALLREKGYAARTNQILRGICVSHEMDVTAKKDGKHYLFECKFHNRPGFRTDVKTVLYIKARYDDLYEKFQSDNKHAGERHHMWIVTNTQFTSEARRYAKCVGMSLMSWRYPSGKSLAELIDETGLHPVTALTHLTLKQKHQLINEHVILCRDLRKRKDILKKIGVHGKKRDRILREAEAICTLKNDL